MSLLCAWLGHKWRPVLFDKFGTGRREFVLGYRCERCWTWQREAE